MEDPVTDSRRWSSSVRIASARVCGSGSRVGRRACAGASVWYESVSLVVVELAYDAEPSGPILILAIGISKVKPPSVFVVVTTENSTSNSVSRRC